MNKAVLLYLIFVLLTATQAVAGVVEDAEDQIKKLRKENRGHTQPHVVTNYPAPSSSDGSSSPASRKTPGMSGQGSVGQGSVGDSAPTAAAAVQHESLEKPERRRRAKPRDKSDKLLSIFGILVLLLLIGAGTAFGKRRESTR